MQCRYLFISLIFSDMFIYGARNFHSRRTRNEKSKAKTGAGKWSRFLAPVSGVCVMGLTDPLGGLMGGEEKREEGREGKGRRDDGRGVHGRGQPQGNSCIPVISAHVYSIVHFSTCCQGTKTL